LKRITRRDRLKIYGDLLAAITNADSTEKIVLTRIQVQINVPFDRLKNYITELTELGLIHNEESLRLTEKGKQYLMEYEKVLEIMRRIGLTYR
jgi:predicted transcriptional regulator